jgi:hypothetical protein
VPGCVQQQVACACEKHTSCMRSAPIHSSQHVYMHQSSSAHACTETLRQHT